jgi:hypothetical protein
MQTGTQGRYKWLEADLDLCEFLSVCPAAILGRHIAITAVDSGSFCPSEEDRAVGWTATGGIAYSPRIESISKLPSQCCCRDCGPFDEWYIFRTQPTPFGAICRANVFETAIAPPNVFQFINFGAFRLSDPQMKAITDLFWQQIEWVRPEHTWATATPALCTCLPIMNASAESSRF